MDDSVLQADWEQAKMYVVRRLSEGLPPTLYYHNLAHTLEDVLPAAERLAHEAGIAPSDLLLLRTAALYHDMGYLLQYYDNERIAAQIAAETLPQFGYAPEQVQQIQELILATHVPQAPKNLLEALLCDADLDSLGREDFPDTNRRLRLELAVHVKPVPLESWLVQQLHFLSQHQYWTPYAKKLRQVGKQRNLQFIRETLSALREGRAIETLISQPAY